TGGSGSSPPTWLLRRSDRPRPGFQVSGIQTWTGTVKSSQVQDGADPEKRSAVNLVARYTRWLHTRWPAGSVEKLPEIGSDGSTNVPGVYIAGDLSGIPLLKFALDG